MLGEGAFACDRAPLRRGQRRPNCSMIPPPWSQPQVTSVLRKLLILPPILIGAAVLAFVVSQKQAPETEAPLERSRHVRVIAAPEVPVVPRVLGYGTVSPEKVWNAVAQVSGEIVYVHPEFKKGAILRKDTEILRISPIDYELAITQAEANIRSSEAKLKELEVTGENTQAALAIEQRALELREKELARKEELLKSGTVAQSAVDQERRDTLAQRKKVQDLENSLRLIPTQKTVETEQKAVFEAQLADTRLDLERTHIKMPFDARIAEANAEITQFVPVGHALAVADGVEVSEVEAQVPIALFSQLAASVADENMPVGITPETISRVVRALGLHVTVRLGAGDQSVEWEGRFSRVSDTIDPNTRTIGIFVSVEGAYAKAVAGVRPPLTKGMFVEVELSTRPLGPRVVVPRSAIRGGRLYVVNAESRLEIREVRTGLVQGDFAEIVSGLRGGEKIVVSDLSPAIDGMLLRTSEDEDALALLIRGAAGEVPLR